MQTYQTSISPSAFSTFFAYNTDRRCCLSLRVFPLVKYSSSDRRKSIRLQSNVFTSSVICPARGREQLKHLFLMRKTKRGRLVLARASGGPEFNFGGGGGLDSNTKRLLGNLALAILLTYLSMTGQLGLLLDAAVSIWQLAFLLPIVGLGALLLFLVTDIIQDSCPSCGNEFRVLKSAVKDGVPLCPYCAQPVCVQDNKFVRESTKDFSDQSSQFGQAFNGFSRSYRKEKTPSVTVDVEAEIKDVDP